MAGWRKEIGTALLLLSAALLAGTTVGHTTYWLLLVSVYFLLNQIVHINRFERWIALGGKRQYPKASGIWEDIYYHVYRIKKNEKRRNRKLSKMVDQFRKSTEALPDAAIVLNTDDQIEWSNKAANSVFGLKPSDRGQRIPNLIRFPEFINYLKAGNYKEAVILPSPMDSRVTLAVRIVSYSSGLRLLLAQDVTELKKMERMRKDFVANVSHELRTPLTVLKGYLETLQDMDDGSSSLLSQSVQQMKDQTERMQHLVDDLLLLARLETQKKTIQCIDVPALLSQICKEGDALENASRRIELTLEADTHILGEVQELRSAFTNLLGNALKYSPEDSVVKVRWHRTHEAVVLDVEDSGEGIALADIPRVTERFYRAEVKRNKKIQGTGLGLAIVKHVLMRHDAKLGIVSKVGKGSRFSCYFPVSRICN
ncbi:MAG: phosphate regulon sensor histidine kinase PhoR [Methylobacter sp.]|nr:MAG: phosphate regulon sensor histidine kinase PhoR [Methylobacter sp.]PPD04904.1 MAG: phosphate regulon sensor histidine kinase PhoR [Methylobacter sp.]PPD23695.1 MAG: phosphate regulon sensor histidine kinase PhoR [Methylobacter sp.]PPD32527.1 MAG: phosphate regulon sensor histidine kinase PhoR [Methylomonas sp.]